MESTKLIGAETKESSLFDRYNLSLWLTLLTIFLITTSGCSEALESSVTGNVSLDGNPVRRGAVVFDPVEKGMLAKGILSSKGDYRIKTNSTQGLMPGKYRVKVLAREDSPDPPDGSLPAPGKLLVPRKYTSVRSSGLEYEILPGGNQIDIVLVSE